LMERKFTRKAFICNRNDL